MLVFLSTILASFINLISKNSLSLPQEFQTGGGERISSVSAETFSIEIVNEKNKRIFFNNVAALHFFKSSSHC